MKSDSFSGFSSLKAGEALKQRIMRDIESGGAGRAKRKRLLRRFILSVA